MSAVVTELNHLSADRLTGEVPHNLIDFKFDPKIMAPYTIDNKHKP